MYSICLWCFANSLRVSFWHTLGSTVSTKLTGVSWLTHKTSSHVLSFFNLLTASPNGGQYQLKLKECKSTFYQMYWTNRINYRPKGFVCKRRAVSFPLFVSREGMNLCLTNRIRICRVPQGTNETRWSVLMSLKAKIPSTLRGCIGSIGCLFLLSIEEPVRIRLFGLCQILIHWEFQKITI